MGFLVARMLTRSLLSLTVLQAVGVSAQDKPPLEVQIQKRLTELKYSPDVVTAMGPQTKEAIREYQRTVGLEVTGEPSEDLLRSLQAPCQAMQVDFDTRLSGGCEKPKDVGIPGVRVIELK